MLKRDLAHEMLSRELQALGELFSREPEAEWAGFARDHDTVKRDKIVTIHPASATIGHTSIYKMNGQDGLANKSGRKQ